MTPAILRALLDWFMSSDPWPESVDQKVIEAWLNEQCRKYGYDGWLDAFHRLPKE